MATRLAHTDNTKYLAGLNEYCNKFWKYPLSRGERDFQFWVQDQELGDTSLSNMVWDQPCEIWLSVSM